MEITVGLQNIIMKVSNQSAKISVLQKIHGL